MKKITLFSLLLLFALTMNAQVELKALIGTNFSTLHGSDEEVSARVGIQYGAGVLIGNKFYVEPGIQFVTSATEINIEGTPVDFTQNLVKVPVYLGYHLLGEEDQPFALRIFAGPAMSIPGKIKKGADQITKDSISNSIWSVDGGIGFDLFFLFAEASYEYSLNDYFAEAFSMSGKHGAFIINAGIHIDF